MRSYRVDPQLSSAAAANTAQRSDPFGGSAFGAPRPAGAVGYPPASAAGYPNSTGASGYPAGGSGYPPAADPSSGRYPTFVSGASSSTSPQYSARRSRNPIDSIYPTDIEQPPAPPHHGGGTHRYAKRSTGAQMSSSGGGGGGAHQKRMSAMQSMRKHRSLDGSQFIRDFEAAASNPTLQNFGDPYAASGPASFPYGGVQADYGNPNVGMGTNMQPMTYDDLLLSTMPFPSTSANFAQSRQTQPLDSIPTSVAYAQTAVDDVDTLRRENLALNQRLGYMMNTIKTFWSPELKRERQQRKEESARLANFQDKVFQQSSEIQQIRNELDRREKDIHQLIGGPDFMDMEEELRRLRGQFASSMVPGPATSHSTSSGLPSGVLPRDYTDKMLNTHEIHTLKMKMERSELALAEGQRDLQAMELRLKGAEEQNTELEKRLEIVGRSNTANDAQVKLLQDDVNMLRSKLETRNQLIESKEKRVRELEKDVDILRQQLQESGQGIYVGRKEATGRVVQNQDHRNTQLQVRLDQLETLLRERDAELDRTKQRLLQQPGNRIEQELQQRIEELETDKRKLQDSVDSLRATTELEKQQQLLAFQDETRQLRATIDSLQKELADRQVLLASQNEKISQFDSQLKSSGMDLTVSLGADGTMSRPPSALTVRSDGVVGGRGERCRVFGDFPENPVETLQRELDEARHEVGQLLGRLQTLERDNKSLQSKLNLSAAERTIGSVATTIPNDSTVITKSSRKGDPKNMRIDELEEALRESVGITAEREKQLNDQKQLIQQLSTQLNDLYKDPSRRLKGTGKTDAEQKAWEEERQRYQRQLVNFRKEVTMAAIREKEACIQLLQGPPESLKDKVEILNRQKEQLRHRLLTQTSESYSTAVDGPYLANVWMAAQQQPQMEAAIPQPQFASPPQKPLAAGATAATATLQRHYQQPPYSSYVAAGQPVQNGSGATNPMNISIPAYGTVPSAPASFTFGVKVDPDDGIWA